MAFAAIFLFAWPLLNQHIKALYSTFDSGYTFYQLWEIFRLEWFVLSSGIPTYWSIINVSLFSSLFLLGLWSIDRQEQRLILLGFFVIPILTIYGLSLAMPIFLDRYIIEAAIGFYGLVALGVESLANARQRYGWIALILLVSANGINIIYQKSHIITLAN